MGTIPEASDVASDVSVTFPAVLFAREMLVTGVGAIDMDAARGVVGTCCCLYSGLKYPVEFALVAANEVGREGGALKDLP